MAGSPTPPTDPRQRVASEDHRFAAREPARARARPPCGCAAGVPMRKESIPAVWPGVPRGTISSAPRSSLSPASTVALTSPARSPSRSRSSGWIRHHEPGPALPEGLELAHVIEVVVGQEDVCWARAHAARPPGSAARPDHPRRRRRPDLPGRRRPGRCSTGTGGASRARRSSLMSHERICPPTSSIRPSRYPPDRRRDATQPVDRTSGIEPPGARLLEGRPAPGHGDGREVPTVR